jgi:putative membrane protein
MRTALPVVLTSFSGQGIWIWTWEPSVLIGLTALTLGYALLTRRLRLASTRWPRQAAFHLGTLVAFIALISPLDHLADQYLLSAHMVQHLLLLMVSPPLWLVGIPPDLFRSLRIPRWMGSTLRWLAAPIAAFAIYNLVLWIWHIPAFYEAALYNEPLHILEHLSFQAAALLGWWPVLGFLPEITPRPAYPVQFLYLFATMLSSTALGALLSLAKTALYPFYANAPRVLNGLPLPTLTPGPRLWELGVLDDQRIAGLIMWLPGNMLYFIALMIIFGLWMRQQERAEI